MPPPQNVHWEAEEIPVRLLYLPAAPDTSRVAGEPRRRLRWIEPHSDARTHLGRGTECQGCTAASARDCSSCPACVNAEAVSRPNQRSGPQGNSANLGAEARALAAGARGGATFPKRQQQIRVRTGKAGAKRCRDINGSLTVIASRANAAAEVVGRAARAVLACTHRPCIVSKAARQGERRTTTRTKD